MRPTEVARLQMNTVNIVVDTLREDHTDAPNYKAQKTGLTAAEATAPATWTFPA